MIRGSHFGGKNGVHDKGFTFWKKGCSYFWKRGFIKRGVHVNPLNPPGYGPGLHLETDNNDGTKDSGELFRLSTSKI